MAVYRQIHVSFWQDPFVLDLTPEEKYFYIYLMTNSKTTQCGIYELPKKVAMFETGYNEETVDKLMQRFIGYKKIVYDPETEEVMLINWIKHNYSSSPKVIRCVEKELINVKSEVLKKKYNTVSKQYQYTMDTEPQKEEEKEEEKEKEEEYIPAKKQYAQYVKMTEDEYRKLIDDYGERKTKDMIEDLNNYKGSKGKKYKSDYLTIRLWIRKEDKNAGSKGKPDYDKSKFLA